MILSSVPLWSFLMVTAWELSMPSPGATCLSPTHCSADSGKGHSDWTFACQMSITTVIFRYCKQKNCDSILIPINKTTVGLLSLTFISVQTFVNKRKGKKESIWQIGILFWGHVRLFKICFCEILILSTNLDPFERITFDRLIIKEGPDSTVIAFQQAVPRLNDPEWPKNCWLRGNLSSKLLLKLV